MTAAGRRDDRGTYRADIDGLRAIAICSVVAYHVGLSGAPGGFTGVDVFFVISGYLITGLLARELAETGRVDLAAFYARRVRRIVPALVTMLAVTLLATAVLLPRLGQQQGVARSALAALAFVANHYFQRFTGGYFDTDSELHPLLHLWSLSVEEQFYLLWPLALAWLWRRAGGPAVAGRRRAVVGVSVLLAFLLSLRLSWHAPASAFFLLPARAWELGVGAAAALLPWRSLRPTLGGWLAAAGVAAMSAGFVLIPRTAPFPGFVALLPVLGCAAVIVGGATSPASLSARLLGGPVLVGVGRLAYGWYLWHWPMLSLARGMRLGDPAPLTDLAVAVSALGVAALSYRFIERPLHRVATPSPVPRTLRAGAVALAATALIAVAVGAFAKYGPRSAAEQRARLLLEDGKALVLRCTLMRDEWQGALATDRCVRGRGSPAIAIWGDSHGSAWAPALDTDDDRAGRSHVVQTMSGCAPLLGLVVRSREGHLAPQCARFNDSVAAWLDHARPAGVRGVLLIARWPMYEGAGDISVMDKGHYDADSSAHTPAESRLRMREGLRRTLAHLDRLGLRVVILLPAIELPHEVGVCLVLRPASDCGVTRAAYQAHAAPTSGVLREVGADFRNVRILDPVDFFCDAELCPAMRGDMPMLRDDDHVSSWAAAAYGRTVGGTWRWLRGE